MLYAVERPDGTIIEESVRSDTRESWRGAYKIENSNAWFCAEGSIQDGGESLGYRLVTGEFVKSSESGAGSPTD